MTYTPGDRLGPYEILGIIGEGGMGEVYKARDTRLDRTVAIKFSKEQFSARFDREARSIAALNHPNICQVYDVGPNYLVMEHVDGNQLQGPLPLPKALEIAGQILDALDAAHKKRIIHRDLKPANILSTRQGIKLLDFGLAKQSALLDDPDATIAAGLSKKGEIAGTLQYMSPEQLHGEEADARSDIFSFGCVLYELISGKRAFEGATAASVIAAILEREPSSLELAPPLDRVIRRCLAKDPDARFQTANDLKTALAWAADATPMAAAIPKPSRTGWIAAGVLAIVALFLLVRDSRRPEESAQTMRLYLNSSEKSGFRDTPVISPNGRMVTSSGVRGALVLRAIDSLEFRLLPGTEGATEPFWSPDSRSVAFFADGKLKRVEIAGGPATTICEVQAGRGGSWGTKGVIVFAPDFVSGIFQVPATGGRVEPITKVDPTVGENSHRYPAFLPDGRHFLFTARGNSPERSRILAGDTQSTTIKPVLSVNSTVAYSPSGHLLFAQGRALMAQPFDADKMELSGAAIPVEEKISFDNTNARARFSVSQNGVIVYSQLGSTRSEQFNWFDRSGRSVSTVGAPGILDWPAISPDGNSLAFTRQDSQTETNDIWLYDLTRNTESRFTSSYVSSLSPAWSPDGSIVTFVSVRPGVGNIFQRPSSGASMEQMFWKLTFNNPRASGWSPDGRYLVMHSAPAGTKLDIFLVPSSGGELIPYLQTKANEHSPRLNPKGDLLAYASDDTGRDEVYVSTFPTAGPKWRVSTNGGSMPVWSRDGRELFFVSADRKMMAADVKGGTKFEAGVPKARFDVRMEANAFDVGKDGRFLIPTTIAPSLSLPRVVVLNWLAALKR